MIQGLSLILTSLMNRALSMKIFQAAFFLLVIASAGTAIAASPNIVYILCDDLGYGDVQCFNTEHGKIPTPNIDRLASQGMMFTNAHSASAVCTPTRYGLLTGRYCWRTKLQSGVVTGHADPLIDKNRLTVPAFLKTKGYNTAIVGKWHLNFNYTDADGNKIKKAKKKKGKKGKGKATTKVTEGTVIPDGPLTRGFDYFYGFHHAREMDIVIENDRVIKSFEPMRMLGNLTKKAAAYIDGQSKSSKPFFLYLPLNSPHTPIVPSEKWQGKSGIGSYGDFVMETDWAVGETIKAIDRNGLADNTLVIFTSDNGCSKAAGIDKLRKQGHYVSGPLRGSKADIWEGGHRVPFVVRWPNGNVKAGSNSEQLICHNDLFATCAEIFATKLADNVAEDSVSFLPALTGKPISKIRPAVIHHSVSGRFAIRQGDWKLNLCPGSAGWTAPKGKAAKALGLPDFQLYDLNVDLAETNNLQSAEVDRLKLLMELLKKLVSDGRSTPGKKQTNDSEIKIIKD